MDPNVTQDLIDSISTLTKEVNALKNEKTTVKLADVFKAKGIDKGIDEKYLETQLIGRKFNSEKEVDELIESIAPAYEQLTKTLSGDEPKPLTNEGKKILDDWNKSHEPYIAPTDSKKRTPNSVLDNWSKNSRI